MFLIVVEDHNYTVRPPIYKSTRPALALKVGEFIS